MWKSWKLGRNETYWARKKTELLGMFSPPGKR